MLTQPMNAMKYIMLMNLTYWLVSYSLHVIKLGTFTRDSHKNMGLVHVGEQHGLTWKECEDTEFCCSKEGFRESKVNIVDRQRAHTSITRTRCKARVIVTTTNTNDQWVISKSYQKHIHALCTPTMTPFIRSNRAQAGGYHNVGFTHKDLNNALQRDESGALHNLIWSDSTSRSDYICFGDVITFDTTYKDNLYGRPIMPIVGVNHHHNTIVFATAIIADETSQYFEWVLHNFLEAMMNKSPISVVTDGDSAMQRAIKSVIPNAKHRLCYWHLSRNAQANIGDPKFTAAFSKCMASWWTTDKFDIQWRSVVSEFNVEKHPWVIEKGNTRHLCAQAYLTGHFFANIRSTQRCESMNASLAIALKHKKTYLDVVHAIEDGISRMRLNELKADYLSSQTKPFQITKLVEFESHASEIFTHKSFHAFQEELQRETLYRIQEEIQSLSDECQYFYLKKYKEKNRTFEISFDSRTKTLNCSCRKFKTIGLSCRHQIHVLKHLDYTYLPGYLIQSRWTKDAKASVPSFVDLNVPQEIMQMARFASLRANASMLCYSASKTDVSFKITRDEMKRLTEEFENSFGLNDSVNRSSVLNNVRDPQRKQSKRKEVTKNKVEKKIRRCGFCNGEGHNKLTCPQVKLGLNTSTQSTSTDFF
ncbi:hypothetical protein F3Y22_tig00110384pilonHSYRG00856 [Hibiscus syriacus]|uniref:SWIM-type domain-containing protein n=1 Tax=Hibiscus syriacus TaxID=106335 RepID=A0A6A3AUN0_HIBSY|nr:hypothetical protein F3Y22_tig00110384pilonHSYRG00856 [Hibiscus syriacus]